MKKKYFIVFNKVDLAPPGLPQSLRRLHTQARKEKLEQPLFSAEARRDIGLLACAEKIYFTSLRASSQSSGTHSARQGHHFFLNVN